MSLVEIQNMNRNFGKDLILFNNLNLTIDEGDKLALVGANGSGKTTLLKLIAGLMLPTEGNIVVNGLNTADQQKQIHNLVGWVPADENSFFPRLNGEENLQAFLKHRIPKGELQGKLHEFSLEPVAGKVLKTPYYLASRGMKQILNLMRALFLQPKILLLDEPSIGLDKAHRDLFLELLKKDLTLVIASHNTSFLSEICTREFNLGDHLC